MFYFYYEMEIKHINFVFCWFFAVSRIDAWIEAFFQYKNNKNRVALQPLDFTFKNYNILCLLELFHRRKIRLSDNTACSFQAYCS